MGTQTSVIEPPTKQQKLEDTSIVSLIWLDDSNQTSDDNVTIQVQLRTFDPNLKIFQDDKECEDYIKSQSDQSLIVLIVNGKLGQQIVPRVQDLPQIISIYVFCFNKEFHETWAKQIAKVKDVVTHFGDLKDQIQMSYFNTIVDQPVDYEQPNAGEYELDSSYIISDISSDYLSQIEPTANETTEFIGLYRTTFEGHPQRMALLQEFQESYSSDAALSWSRRDPVFIQILEHIFQMTNVATMYHCRFLIRDIRKQFEKYKCTSPITAYRGQSMSDENFEQLKNSEGKIIAMKSFFSTTLARDIAILYISEENEQKRVLFEVDANPQTEGVKPFIKPEPLFNQNDDEDEVLFMLGSLFRINEIRDENGITIIKMTLCANEDNNLIKSQLTTTNEEKDVIGYARLQYELSQIVNNPRILENVDKLLEKYLSETLDSHPNRIRCYEVLEMITFAQGNWDGCLDWSQKSLEIKKKTLPSNDPQLALSYENISFIYFNKRENKQALDALKQALTICREIYGDDHLNLIPYYVRMIEMHEYEGQFTDVLLCYNQTYSIMLKHYPIDDLNLTSIYNNIGKTFVSLSQYALALGYYQTSLDIKVKHLSPSSDSIALTYKSIGFVYKYLGNIDQAKIHFEKAAVIYSELHSSTHETVLEIEQLIQNLSTPSES